MYILDKLDIKIMKNYHYLYLKCEVLLLADVRNSSLKIIRLCQSHCLSALILSCDAMLNMAKVDLELI